MLGRLLFALVLLIPADGIAQVSPPAAPAAAAAAHNWGELYENILADAWASDSNALGFMFGYEDQTAFKGRAAAEHRAVLLALLRHVGDSTYAAALKGEVPRCQRAVLRSIRRAAGPHARAVQRANPRTFALGAPLANDR